MKMMPAADLVECSNCDGMFAAASLDDVFYHATGRCCSRETNVASANMTTAVAEER